MVKQRRFEDGLGDDEETVAHQLRLGMSYLAGDRKLRSIADFARRADR